MKQIICFLPVFLLMLCLHACEQESLRTEYTHAIPANANQVAYVNLNTLVEKAGFTSPLLSGLLGKLTGIDREAPVYVFRTPSLPGTVAVLKVADLTLLKVAIAALTAEGSCTSPAKVEEYNCVNMADAGLQLAYNNGTLLAVFGKNVTELGKLQPAVAALMRQTAEGSISNHPHFAAMKEQKGDIRLLFTPDALPFNLRTILNHPHGTWLLGRMTFENGRLYATVQEADFKGDTWESNQPFHPTSQRELQQAMTLMASGRPFHIGLSNEELLTLTNLRALMEFAPDEETRSLYDLVMKIESITARGDSRRTSFTVILKEQHVNALKQLVDYAQWFIKF